MPNSIDVIGDLRAALAQARVAGQSSVQIESLENYLTAAESAARSTESPQQGMQEALSQFRHDFEVWKVQAPINSAHGIEMFKSVIEAGQTALRSATIINGGAAAALLAFLGNLLTKEAPHGVSFPISEINHAMLVFVIGVGLAGLATGVRYLTQLSYSLDHRKIGNWLNLFSNLLATGSFGAFFGGGYMAFLALGA